MARVAPTLYEFVEADNGDYLKVSEAVLRIFDRQEWLRVNRARARIKVLIDKIGIDAFREQVEEELQGDWVGERDFDVERLRFDDDEEENAPEAPRRPRLAQWRPLRVRPLPRGQRPAAAPGRLRRGRGQDRARRPHPGAVPRPGRDHARVHRRLRAQHRAAEPGPALGPRRGALRRLAAAGRARPRRGRRATRSPTWSAAPAPTAANSASPARWASTGRSSSGSRRWRSPTS